MCKLILTPTRLASAPNYPSLAAAKASRVELGVADHRITSKARPTNAEKTHLTGPCSVTLSCRTLQSAMQFGRPQGARFPCDWVRSSVVESHKVTELRTVIRTTPLFCFTI